MRIAIAVSKKGTVSKHFGQSVEYRVFTFEKDELVGQESRGNPHRGAHHHGHHGHGGAQLQELGGPAATGGGCGDHGAHEGGGHGHDWIIETLGDCGAVVCGGMGGGARAALEQNGIRIYNAGGDLTPEQAARMAAKGELGTGGLSCPSE